MNTLNDQTLENVTVQMEPTEAYEVLCYVPVRSLPYNQPGTCYTLVALPKEDPTAGELISRYPQDENELGSLCTSHLYLSLIKSVDSLISVLMKRRMAKFWVLFIFSSLKTYGD